MNTAKLRAVLRDLVGELCFSVLGGAPGEALVLDFGKRQPRALRLANRQLSFAQRTFEGTAGILVDCGWALDGPNGRVVTHLESTLKEGPSPLVVLEGDKVAKVSLPAPGLDPLLVFRSGHTLRIWAHRVDPQGREDNWAVWSERGTLTVGPGGRLSGPPEQKPGDDGDLVTVWRARWRAAGRAVPEEE
ncbi:MAG: hypothetical protein IPG45_13240 [Deltaproteobacteria bacterium]|nr:hypothetical protein [Deltaproteobacteria bacterium]